MTTYTLTGYKFTSVGGTIALVSDTQLSLVVMDSLDSISYSVLFGSPGSVVPRVLVDLVGGDPYNVLFGGLDESIVFPEGGNSFENFAFIDWGVGNTSYMLTFHNGSNVEYLFQIGGDALPDIGTLAQIRAFVASATDVGEVTTGPYAPGVAIDLAGIPGMDVNENDIIKGTADANEFHAGLGRDIVHGNGGNDILFGGAARDKIYGDAGDDKLFGGNDNDKVFGGVGNDRVFGGKGSDTLFGNHGNDLIQGNAGNDRLFGGAQNDRLIGGRGNDHLTGGSGRDQFVFSGARGQGSDTVHDFRNGADKIKIGGSVVFADLTIDAVGTDTVISWLNNQVTLLDTASSSITAGDFIF